MPISRTKEKKWVKWYEDDIKVKKHPIKKLKKKVMDIVRYAITPDNIEKKEE